MINLQAYVHFKTFKLYKASTLHDVNLLKTAKLVGPPELVLLLVHYLADDGLQALSSAVLMGCSQELEPMLRLRMEQRTAQRPLVASAMSIAQGQNSPW